MFSIFAKSSLDCDGDVLTAVNTVDPVNGLTGAVEGRKGEGDLLRLTEVCR